MSAVARRSMRIEETLRHDQGSKYCMCRRNLGSKEDESQVG